MGMIDCKIHGLSAIMPCCAHMGEDRKPSLTRAFIALNEHYEPRLLCLDCHNRVLSQVDESTTDQIPRCGDCLDEWYRETGQGELSLALKWAMACAYVRKP